MEMVDLVTESFNVEFLDTEREGDVLFFFQLFFGFKKIVAGRFDVGELVHSTTGTGSSGLDFLFRSHFEVRADGLVLFSLQSISWSLHRSPFIINCMKSSWTGYFGSFVGGLSFLFNFGQSSSLLLHFPLFLLFNLATQTIFFFLLHHGQAFVLFSAEHLFSVETFETRRI